MSYATNADDDPAVTFTVMLIAERAVRHLGHVNPAACPLCAGSVMPNTGGTLDHRLDCALIESARTRALADDELDCADHFTDDMATQERYLDHVARIGDAVAHDHWQHRRNRAARRARRRS